MKSNCTACFESCRRFLLFALLCIRVVFAYTDPEIEKLLDSLSDPYHPSLEDYRLIEHYFQYGDRPYIETIRRTAHVEGDDFDFRIHQLRNFKLVGPNGEMPIMELHPINVREETQNKCILIYASYNPHYPQRALRLLGDLKECGYSGYVMLRIGGFPNISNDGIKLCTLPFTFRIAFFQEALHMGFTKILYLDGALHPLNDLSAVFDAMDKYGYFSSHMGGGWYTPDRFHTQAKFYNISAELRPHIPFIQGYATGLNFTDKKICQLFETWNRDMQRVDEFCQGDDVVFSILIWNLDFPLYFPFETTVHISDFPPFPDSLPPSFLFYMDQHKVAIRQGWGSLYD